MDHAAHPDMARVFGALALLIAAARLGGHAAGRLRLPAVIGELGVGLLLGNVGVAAITALSRDTVIDACAEVGVLLLMFEVGLESNPRDLGRVGLAATLVAVTGVLAPMGLGVGVSALFRACPSVYGHLFVGATLAATSVGITARVLRDMGRMQSLEARIILAAAVLDDILGLILLALVAALVRAADSASAVSVGAVALIVAKAVAFLVLATLAGRFAVPWLFRGAARLAGKGTLITTALALCFAFAFAADRFGLAPAIGAFFAGLAIRREDYSALTARGEGALEEPLAPVAALFVPLFFVVAGLKVDLRVFGDARVLGMAATLTLAAIAGKLVAGVGARRSGASVWAIGVGMIPRGEVGLIFATVGATLRLHGQPVIPAPTFSAIVVVVVVSSLLPPPLLARIMRSRGAPAQPVT